MVETQSTWAPATHWQEAKDEGPERDHSQILKEFLDGEQFVPVETESRGRVLPCTVMSGYKWSWL